MILSYASIIPYTISQLSWKSNKSEIDDFFVLGEYTILENGGSVESSRNRCYSIQDLNGCNNYFLKQPKVFVKEHILSIIREQAFYSTIHENKSLSKILSVNLPFFFDFNERDIIFILEWINNSNDFKFFRTLENNNDFLIQNAKQSGEVLRKYHDTLSMNKELFEKNSPLFFDIKPIKIFEVDFEILEFQQQFRSDLQSLIDVLISNPKLANIVKMAQKFWKQEKNKTIIHGDFKERNILIKHQSSSIYLIDWEYANWGVPEYDLASFYFYQLVCDDFKVTQQTTDIFNALLTGYYGTNKVETEKINIFCKARIINYQILNSVSNAKDEHERSKLIEKLNLIVEILNQDNIIPTNP